MMKHILITLLLLSIIFMVTSSFATQTTFQFSGTVDYLTGPYGLPNPLIDTFHIGQTFVGYITFDPNASVTYKYNGRANDVRYGNSIINYHFQFDDLYADFDSGDIRISDNVNLGIGNQDYFVSSSNSSTNVNTNITIPNYELTHYYFRIMDDTATMFQSSDLPNQAPDISYFYRNATYFLNFNLQGGTEEARISGKINTLSNPPVVPEPVSSILFVTGGTLLAGIRYIKRWMNERGHR